MRVTDITEEVIDNRTDDITAKNETDNASSQAVSEEAEKPQDIFDDNDESRKADVTAEDSDVDEPSYAEFDGNDALELIVPVEEPTEKIKEKNEPSNIFSVIPVTVEKLGDITVSHFLSFVSKYGSYFVSIFAVTALFFKKTFISAKSFLRSIPDSYHEDVRGVRTDLKIIRKGRQLDKIINRRFTLKPYLRYFFKSFKRRKGFWTSVVNLLFPIVTVAAILIAYGYIQKTTYALEVTINNESIGYIENEETFEKAKKLALQMIPQAVDSQSSALIFSEPVFKLSRVPVNKLSNSSMICENMIEASDASLVRACGIYIDGDFLCAVRNESDAVSVFNSLIAPKKANAAEGTIVDFVEEIEYVEGLYPDNEKTLWDTLALKKKLKEPKTEAKYHTVKRHDNVRTIAKKYGLTTKQLKALNPSVNFNKLLKKQSILVSPQTDYVRIKVMKTRTKTSVIPFEKIKRESSYITKGTTKISQRGSNGKKVTTELVTYINGKETYSTVVSVKTVKAPVNEITLIGTRVAYSGYSGSSSGSSYSYTPSYSSGMIWPARGAYSLSSRYGYRSAHISGWSFHGGVDIIKSGGGSTGIPVVAAASGTVVVAYSGYSGYGHTVVIDHGNGLQTRYAHMQPGSIAVRVGQKVYQGQQVGRIGSTGNVTGPHLHFEVLKNGSKVNPLGYIG